ncbi:MAG: molecular chaperone SurA [Gammaproteobacteria bacterium RBG_16_57_12]|nr:MAG: molecular chaperone SurA [Gammaproteobacteria bacterium RBG_16_57_12]
MVRALGLCLLAFPLYGHAAAEPLDQILAVVDEEVITRTELDNQIGDIRRQFVQQGRSLPADDIIRRQLLERLILTKVQLHLASDKGIQIDDDTLDRALENIATQNSLSLKDFRDTLQRDGYNYARFRNEVRNEIAINRLRQREIDSRIVVTEQEVDNLLTTQAAEGSLNNEYQLFHILIAIPESAAPEQIKQAQQQAETVQQALQNGADFGATAIQYSAADNALQGGDLGWRKAGQLPTIFAEQLGKLQTGQISAPFRSASGFHIIRLNGIRTADTPRHIVHQTLARHILIKADEVTPAADVRMRLERLKDRLEQGEDFAELARSYSDDRRSAADGGSLGWVNPGQMVPEFEKVMEALAPGKISEPFQSRFGWHLAQVLEHREMDNTEEYRRDKARETIHKRKSDEEYETWLRRVRDEAFVEMRVSDN